MRTKSGLAKQCSKWQIFSRRTVLFRLDGAWDCGYVRPFDVGTVACAIVLVVIVSGVES
jgi:hypothetical protein